MLIWERCDRHQTLKQPLNPTKPEGSALMTKHIVRLLAGLFILVLAACAPEEPLPTIAPTATPEPPTATATITPTATATSTPTLTPTATLPVPRTEAFSADEQAFFRVAHALPGDAVVDLYVDGLLLASALNYGQVTGQSGIIEGNYTVRAVTNGGNPIDDVITQTDVTILGGQSVILMFSGTAQAPTLQAIPEDVAPLAAANSRLVSVNALTDGTTISLGLGADEITPPLAPGTVSRPSLVDSEIDNDLFNIRGANDLVLADYRLNLRARDSYTLIFTGQANNIRVLEVATRVAGLTTLRVLNAATPNLGVDVYLNDEPIATTLTYGAETDPQQVLAGEYTLAVYLSGDEPGDATPVLDAVLNGNPDETVTYILYATETDSTTINAIPVREDTTPTNPGTTRIVYAHAAPNVDTATYEMVEQLRGDVEQEDRVFFGQAARARSIPAGNYIITWQEGGDGVPIHISDVTPLQPGLSYIYILTRYEFVEPILISREVGLTNQPNPVQTLQPQQLDQPTRLRVVNAAPAVAVEFRLDDRVAFDGITYGQTSGALVITSGERVLTAHDANSGQLLARAVNFFNVGERYSVFLQGAPEAGYDLLITLDDDIRADPENPTLRLVNLSQEATRFSISLGPPPRAGQEAAQPDLPRRTVPAGLTRYQTSVTSQTDSRVVPTLREVGLRSAYIVDEVELGLAVILPPTELEAGTHYDVVIYQVPGTLIVDGFTVPYPLP